MKIIKLYLFIVDDSRFKNIVSLKILNFHVYIYIFLEFLFKSSNIFHFNFEIFLYFFDRL